MEIKLMAEHNKNRLRMLLDELIVSNEAEHIELTNVRDSLIGKVAVISDIDGPIHWSKRPENAERAKEWRKSMRKSRKKR